MARAAAAVAAEATTQSRGGTFLTTCRSGRGRRGSTLRGRRPTPRSWSPRASRRWRRSRSALIGWSSRRGTAIRACRSIGCSRRQPRPPTPPAGPSPATTGPAPRSKHAPAVLLGPSAVSARRQAPRVQLARGRSRLAEAARAPTSSVEVSSSGPV